MFPNKAMSSSPAINCQSPPCLGNDFSSSARSFPALAASTIAPGSILPETVFEKSIIAFPNDVNCLLTFSKDPSPSVIRVDNPEIKLASLSLRIIFDRVLAASTDSGLIVVIPSRNTLAFSIKLERSVPNPAKLPFTENNDVNPFTNSAADSKTIAPDKYPTPVKTLLSIFPAPSINPDTLSIKPESAVPNFGKISSIAPANPETMPPTKAPIPVPIACNNGIPLFKNFSNCGNLSLMYPSAVIKPPMAVTTTSNPVTPAIADVEPTPATDNIAVTPVIANNKVDNDNAVFILGFTLKCSMTPNITPRPATTAVNTPMDAIAPLLTPLIVLSIFTEAAIAISNVDIAAPF